MEKVQTTMPIGTIVGERYQVEELLGKGGFGAVYRVRDLRVPQNVFALKENVDPDQRSRRHFVFEGELLTRVDHPSLPRVYRIIDNPTQDRAYILMDYIEGSNLEQLRRQKRGRRFTLGEVLTLLNPIVEAITYLHSQQPPIVHRDIKPSNIIAPASGARAALVDFGIAKEFDQEATTTAIRHASPGYGAPEQYSAGTNPRTDVYGLGATLYALLTGTVPTDSFFRLTQQLSKGKDPLPPVKELIPEIPEHVSSAIARAMALENGERFASIEEFWQALQDNSDTLTEAPRALPHGSIRYVPVSASGIAGGRDAGRVPASAHARRELIVMLALLLLALCVVLASTLFLLAALRSRHGQVPPATTPGVVATHATATATATATPTPSPTPTRTPLPTATATLAASIPMLVSSYSGTLNDRNGDITTSMSLDGIVQQQQHIQGNFSVGLPLTGNGPFTGTVNSSSAIQFTVQSSVIAAPLYFSGTIQKDGHMSGQYCSLDHTNHCNHNVGGYGTWSARPTQ